MKDFGLGIERALFGSSIYLNQFFGVIMDGKDVGDIVVFYLFFVTGISIVPNIQPTYNLKYTKHKNILKF